MGWTGNSLNSFALRYVWLSPWGGQWRHSMTRWLRNFGRAGCEAPSFALESRCLVFVCSATASLCQPICNVWSTSKTVGHASPKHGRKPSFMESKHKAARKPSRIQSKCWNMQSHAKSPLFSDSDGTRNINKPKPAKTSRNKWIPFWTVSFGNYHLPWVTRTHGML